MINKIYLTHCICLYLDTEFSQISGLLSILHFTYIFMTETRIRQSAKCQYVCGVGAVYVTVTVLVLPRLPAQKILSLF